MTDKRAVGFSFVNIAKKYRTGIWATYPWLVCALAAFFYCYESLLRMSPGVMTSELMQHFLINNAAYASLAAFYYYAYTPMQIPVGILMDKYGPRRILTIAAFVCGLGTMIFMYTNLLYIAKIGRFMIGLGSAFAFVGVLKTANIWLPSRYFALVTGLATTLGMLGAVFGQIILASWLEHMAWHQIIWWFGILGLVLAPIVWFVVRDTPKQLATPEFVVKEVTYTYLFKAVKQILKKPQIWIIGTVGCMLFLMVIVFAEMWGPHYLEVAYSIDKRQAVRLISGIFYGFALGGPVIGYLSDKFGKRKLPLVLCSIGSLIVFLILIYVPGLTTTNVAWLMFLFGLTLSGEILVFPMACENFNALLAGTAVAVVNFFTMIGGWGIPDLIGYILDVSESKVVTLNGEVLHSVDSYQLAFVVLVVCLIICTILSFCLKETNCKHVD